MEFLKKEQEKNAQVALIRMSVWLNKIFINLLHIIIFLCIL